ncbi:hypothetical protein CFR80_02720 [Komagataeibacter oboediens]|uniref:Uncharacterized protein n=1 Tax=Komagataeibacter oboediens TaxID=65958 RepID=A0A318QTS3_9PROT|nr:hypothetical protein CFR80_02720 [Komagataeibacter oboediens]
MSVTIVSDAFEKWARNACSVPICVPCCQPGRGQNPVWRQHAAGPPALLARVEQRIPRPGWGTALDTFRHKILHGIIM